MNNIKNLELEILITVSQNKKVPTQYFHHLFEHKWKLYSFRFNELLLEGLFNVVTSTTGISIFELTGKGKTRITELLQERERDVTIRIALLKQRRPATVLDWKPVMALLNSVIHFLAPSEKIRNSEPFRLSPSLPSSSSSQHQPKFPLVPTRRDRGNRKASL
jgi:hypothetical protein